MGTTEIELIAYIDAHPGVTPDALAEHFGVSRRTIRTYVRDANSRFADIACIELRRGRGYELVVVDQTALTTLLERRAHASHPAIPDTREDRVAYLVNDLLTRTGWVTLDDLSAILFISRRTISDDLKQVESVLGQFDLVLEKRPRYGMRVTGTELNRRLCLASMVVSGASGTADPDDIASKIKSIARCVSAATDDADFQINSAAYQNLLVHIAVAVTRIECDCYVPLDAVHLEQIRGGREYPIAAAIARGIERAFNIELPEEEIAYIAIHLQGKKTLQMDDGGQQGIVISDEVWDVVGEMLDVVWSGFHFDFRGDLELRMNLARHIVPLTVRLRYHMHLVNPLLADIKTRFSLAYSMAVNASAVLETRCGASPSEDEVGYIALAFALALEHHKQDVSKKNILIVCASGAGSAKLLEYRYRQEFGGYVDEIRTCDAAHVRREDLSNIDYVFTTVPLDIDLKIPVRQVSFFLDDRDITNMRGLLAARSDYALAAEALSYFDERLFIAHAGQLTKDEVISALCDHIATVRAVPDDFEAQVREREQLAQTAFGNRVAMPHPMEPSTDETFIAVLLLDNPIDWGIRPVQAIFLVSVAHERDHDLNDFYSVLSRMFLSTSAIDELLGDQRFGTLQGLLSRFALEKPTYGSTD